MLKFPIFVTIQTREEECARQAEKARQQRVQRVAYHFKQALADVAPPLTLNLPLHTDPAPTLTPPSHQAQALAKATAVKEGRKESLEAKQVRGLALTLAFALTLTLAQP